VRDCVGWPKDASSPGFGRVRSLWGHARVPIARMRTGGRAASIHPAARPSFLPHSRPLEGSSRLATTLLSVTSQHFSFKLARLREGEQNEIIAVALGWNGNRNNRHVSYLDGPSTSDAVAGSVCLGVDPLRFRARRRGQSLRQCIGKEMRRGRPLRAWGRQDGTLVSGIPVVSRISEPIGASL
jgi:hypothetical protein